MQTCMCRSSSERYTTHSSTQIISCSAATTITQTIQRSKSLLCRKHRKRSAARVDAISWLAIVNLCAHQVCLPSASSHGVCVLLYILNYQSVPRINRYATSSPQLKIKTKYPFARASFSSGSAENFDWNQLSPEVSCSTTWNDSHTPHHRTARSAQRACI